MGHEELQKVIPYKCDAICIGRAEILYISKDKFDKFFSKKGKFDV